MKQLHVLNVGYPRSGTTWIWQNLLHLDGFYSPHEKENRALERGQSVSEYVQSYRDHDITANFSVSNFFADRYVIDRLSRVSEIRTSIIFRNPFEIFWSHYNYLKIDNMSYQEFAALLIREGWFANMAKILTRWQTYFGPDRMKAFFYDDLVDDRIKFFRVYCESMGLPEPRTLTYMTVNNAQYQWHDQILDRNTIRRTNQHILDLAAITGRDLSHWTR